MLWRETDLGCELRRITHNPFFSIHNNRWSQLQQINRCRGCTLLKGFDNQHKATNLCRLTEQMDLPKPLQINKWLFLSFIEWKADKQKDTDAIQSQRERALPAPNFLSNPVISCLIGFWHGFVHKNSTFIQLTQFFFFCCWKCILIHQWKLFQTKQYQPLFNNNPSGMSLRIIYFLNICLYWWLKRSVILN